jgi:hypothetical protein
VAVDLGRSAPSSWRDQAVLSERWMLMERSLFT